MWLTTRLNRCFVLLYEQCEYVVGWALVPALYTAGRVWLCEPGTGVSFRSAGGWPERLLLDDWVLFWCGFDSYSGAQLSSERPLCAGECVYVGCHLTWYHLSLHHTCRQLCIQTASAHLYALTCLILSSANLFHWHAFECYFKPHYPVPIWCSPSISSKCPNVHLQLHLFPHLLHLCPVR